MVQTAEHEQKRAQLAIFNVIEREDRNGPPSGRERLGTEDVYDPHAEDIIIDQRSGSVVIHDVGEEDGR